MDSSHSAFDWNCILTAGVALLQAYIAATLLARKVRTNFPIFFLYVCFNAIGVLISIPAHAFLSDNQYYYFYWASSFINTGLEFGVMFEILVNALKPYSALIDLGKMLFRWAAIFLLFAGVLTALVTAGGQPSKVAAAVALLERSTRLMQCGLLLLFFFLEVRLGLSWRNYNMSIALGLGSTAALDLSFSYLRVQFPARAETLSIIESAFFMSVLAFWAYCLMRPEPARKNVLDSPSRLIFQRWNDVLVSTRFSPVSAMGGVDSFLPNVEQTVDRVMARKMVQ
ncbi:MAG TPA: hypothetical protein VKH81_01475 [Candidatus Angelobacter sp.]|nr:hypothetical protein [Candidatus Angelobacter sp.]